MNTSEYLCGKSSAENPFDINEYDDPDYFEQMKIADFEENEQKMHREENKNEY